MSERLVYFHGMPGGPDEWALCAPGGVSAIVLNRNPAITASELAALLRAQIGAEPVVLIGFSLGVPPALAVAADLGEQVTGLHLISPAAPLQLGDFLDRMAGGPLFRLALSQPWVFRQIVRVEAVLARCTEVDSGARNVDQILNGSVLPAIAPIAERTAGL